MTNKEQMLLMNKDIVSLQEKMDSFDNKLDVLTERLLDPDNGIAARVNRNTSMRKVIVKAVWFLYALAVGAIGTITKIFTT
tara:strand:+ start:1185 stop:1427 length:243 start_codon:yes stop_codon:yes gene_type:complete